MQTGDLNVLGDLCAGGYQLIYDSGQLAASAASVTIPGLNGNVDREYRLITVYIPTVADEYLRFNINGDSIITNYGSQNMDGLNATASAVRYTGAGGYVSGLIGHSSANAVVLSDIILKSKSGTVRTFINKSVENIAGTTVGRIDLTGYSYLDSSTNITSIALVPGPAGAIGSKSHIMLFRRTPAGSDTDATGIPTGDLDVQGDFTADVMQKVYENTLTASAASVTISGLSGDTDTLYNLLIRQVGGADQVWSGFQFNADAGANYGVQALSGTDSSVAAYRETASNNGYLTLTASATGEKTQSETLIYGKSGTIKPNLITSVTGISGTTVPQIRLLGGVWNNSANEITSLKILADTAGILGINTHIELWALKKSV